jgi:hypothetical protein
MMKRHLIWTAIAVAIPLALSVSFAHAQDADDQPRLGETTTEYNLRMARTRKDRDVLREAVRDSQEKAHRDALSELGEATRSLDHQGSRCLQLIDRTMRLFVEGDTVELVEHSLMEATQIRWSAGSWSWCI